jgi:hypothetical protein
MRPAIRIHSLAEARVALGVARELGRPVLLASAPCAAGHAGAGWWRALVEAARAEYPDVDMTAILDCGDSAGDAMEALREGVRLVAFRGRPDVARKLRAIAAQRGAEVADAHPLGLDLRALRDRRAACVVWLRAEAADG